jgi:hypothetical protein
MTMRAPQIAWLSIVQLVFFGALVALGAQYWQPSVATQALQATKPQSKREPPYQFPAGGRTLSSKYRLVALYGSPDAPVLGALGEQNAVASVARVKQLAAQYQAHSKETVLPTFEIIATVASAFPTEDNDYSRPIPTTTMAEWIRVARANNVYVVLDLQSGRADFLKQARQLAPLLAEPNVGLALDPEWRLTPTQIPLRQIGHVSIEEVNATGDWLAQLTRERKLPQKLFLLHQFRNDMLPNRVKLNTAHPELATMIQMDGQGSQSQKQDTWRAINRQAPQHILFGWKNFYHKDLTLLTPAQTMQIVPTPWYISYQ